MELNRTNWHTKQERLARGFCFWNRKAPEEGGFLSFRFYKLERPDIVHQAREPAGLLLVCQNALAVVFYAGVRNLVGIDAVVRIDVAGANHAAHNHVFGFIIDTDFARALNLQQTAGKNPKNPCRKGRGYIVFALGLAGGRQITVGSRLQYGQVVADIALRANAHKGNEAGFALVEHGRDAVVVAALLVGARFSLALGLGVFDKFHNHDIAYALGAAISKKGFLLAGGKERAGIIAAIHFLPVFLRLGYRLLQGRPAMRTARAGRAEHQDRSNKQCQNPVIHFPLLIAIIS